MSLYSNNYNSGLFWNVVTFLGNNLILLGLTYMVCWGFPGGSDGEKKKCLQCRRIPGSGRSPREENGYLLQYSCLENSMDSYSPWCHKDSDTTGWLKTKINAGKDVEKKESLYSVHGFIKWWGYYGKQYGGPLKKEKNRTTIRANNFTSGNISEGNENTTPKEICSPMFITS